MGRYGEGWHAGRMLPPFTAYGIQKDDMASFNPDAATVELSAALVGELGAETLAQLNTLNTPTAANLLSAPVKANG